MIEAYKVDKDVNANVLYTERPLPRVVLSVKILSWGLLVLVLATVMLIMTLLLVPEEESQNLILTALLSTLFGVPLFLLVTLGMSALCAVLISTMDKVFSFGRVYWITCLAFSISALNTSLSFYLLSDLYISRTLMTIISLGVSIGLILGYGSALSKLAGVARKPRLVVVSLCLIYTVLSSTAGLFLG